MRLRNPKKAINQYYTEGGPIFIIEGTHSIRKFREMFSLQFNRIVPTYLEHSYDIPSVLCEQETDSNTSVTVQQPNSWCSSGKYFTLFETCNFMTEFLINSLMYSFIFLYLFVILINFLILGMPVAITTPYFDLFNHCFPGKIFSLKLGCIFPGLLKSCWIFVQENNDLFFSATGEDGDLAQAYYKITKEPIYIHLLESK